MNAQHFDSFTRQATEAISRRRSLMVLGSAGAAVAALASPAITTARKGRKRRKRKKKTGNRQCQQQTAQCEAVFEEGCVEAECEPEQLDALLECCELLETCEIAAYLDCLFEEI